MTEWFRTTRPASVLDGDGVLAVVAEELALLRELGLVESDNTVLGQNGSRYPLPTGGGIVAALDAHWDDRYETKTLQGFKGLRFTPFVGTERLLEKLGEVTVARKGHLKSPWDLDLDVNTDEPVWTNWTDQTEMMYLDGGQWVNRVTFFTEGQLCPGWRIDLVRPDDIELPRRGTAKMTFDRRDTEGGSTPQQHRTTFGEGMYAFERPASPDLVLMDMIASVHRNGVMPHVWTDDRGTMVLCSDAQFQTEDMDAAGAKVPIVYFYRSIRQVRANWDDASGSDGDYAVQGSVGIIPA